MSKQYYVITRNVDGNVLHLVRNRVTNLDLVVTSDVSLANEMAALMNRRTSDRKIVRMNPE